MTSQLNILCSISLHSTVSCVLDAISILYTGDSVYAEIGQFSCEIRDFSG